MLRKMSLIIVMVFVLTQAAAADEDLARISDNIVKESHALQQATHAKGHSKRHADEEALRSVQELTVLLQRYRHKLERHDKGPDLIQLGVTSRVKDGMSILYFDSPMRHKHLRKIQIVHVSGDEYIRIRDITIVPLEGSRIRYNAGGGKFYLGDTYEIELDKPMHIREVRVRVQHKTGGLKILGTPAPEPPKLPAIIELGTTNGVKDGNAVLNMDRRYRKVLFSKLIVKNVSGDEYVRLVNPQVTTTKGDLIFPQISYQKLHSGGAHEIVLSKPVAIKSIQIYVQHRTNGLLITGVR